jgi:hypothetical protein
MIEYRIGWGVNINGASDDGEWTPFDGDATTALAAKEEIERSSGGTVSRLLEEGIEASGFDCWVETRERPGDDTAGQEASSDG